MLNVLLVRRPSELEDCTHLVIIGRRKRLERADIAALLPSSVRAVWASMLKADPGDQGRSTTTWVDGKLQKVTLALLPEVSSRHNSPARTWAWPRLLAGARSAGTGVVAALDEADHAFAAACAAGRSIPRFSARQKVSDGNVRVLLLGPEGPIEPGTLGSAVNAVRHAAELVDLPPDRLGPDDFVARARTLAKQTSTTVHVLRATALQSQGLGGLAAVGRAATQQPALVVLDWAPDNAKSAVCWVGKGITYDTGGLSLKTKTGMPGMKTDMGGAAAVLAAFEAAVELQTPHRLTAVLCIAENAIGPAAVRPDDVLTLYSGKTVEVNNTDAEGRLVLADGVAWAVRHRDPDTLIDIATLTGAQGTATGKMHGALYCNDEALEARAVLAGRASGDLVHPLPYAPELFRKEFHSQIADMKNSVKDRANAQASCAAQFVANHLGDYERPWLHIDMAAPSRTNGRGTGFGVGLLLTLLGCGAPQ